MSRKVKSRNERTEWKVLSDAFSLRFAKVVLSRSERELNAETARIFLKNLSTTRFFGVSVCEN